MQVRDYNAESKDTDDHKYAYEFDSVLRRYMWRRFQPFLNGKTALELGCYLGDFTVLLDGFYDRVAVIEASDKLISKAKARASDKVTFLHSTFENSGLEETFDNIFLIHTMEHLDNPILVLKKIQGWMKPGGRLFIAVPNAHSASRKIAVKMGLIRHETDVTESEKEHGHRITYAFNTLERDVREGGLEIMERGGILFKPFANFQFDALLTSGIISQDYIEGCYALGMEYPELCASIFTICCRPK